MLSKAQVKFFRSLKIKKYRKQYSCFVAEGTKAVLEIVNSDIVVHSIYATPEWLAANPLPECKVSAISYDELKMISFQKSPQEVAGIFSIPEYRVMHEQVKDQLLLVLDDIRDPGNLGTIIRIADWFAIPFVFCTPSCTDIYNPKAIQSTMGSIARVKVKYIAAEKLFGQYPEIPVLGATLNGENLFDLKHDTSGFLVIGNESGGIGAETKKFIQRNISIPAMGGAESLNAAVATGILCAFLKQKTN